MKITGCDFIEAICARLRRKGKLLYDSNIRAEIDTLSWAEINRICVLGEDTPAVIAEGEQLRTTAAAQNTVTQKGRIHVISRQ
jgi:hypothetical protein